jgi:hypothetical protein
MLARVNDVVFFCVPDAVAFPTGAGLSNQIKILHVYDNFT